MTFDLPQGHYSGQQAVGMLTHVSRRAMATDFVVLLPAHAVEAVELVVDALEMLDSIESSLTIYRPGSEISQVNRLGAQHPVKLSKPTFDLLQASMLWSQRTEGAFDVTSGPLIEAWGFNRRRGRKPNVDEISEARDRVGYTKCALDPRRRTIQFDQPGMSINLGAIGKGDALDRLAAKIKQSGISDFLIHGGNSSLIASGNQDPADPRGWAVGLAHPTKPQRRLAGLWLQNQSLATSGSGKQFFHHRGRRFGHVIDPRSGQPAGDLLSLTVIMPSAADADACATGLFVAGSVEIERLLHRRATEKDSPKPVAESDDWRRSPMILTRAGRRQDEVEVESRGQIRWIDPPEDGRQ